jgi:hypothetical protein
MTFGDGDGNQAFICEGKSGLFADVVEGKLVAVPQALQNVAQDVKSTRGTGQDLQPDLVAHLERYFAKMGKPSPFEESHFFGVDEVKSWGVREFERALIDSGVFSKGAARYLCKTFEAKQATPTDTGMAALLESIRSTINDVRG